MSKKTFIGLGLVLFIASFFVADRTINRAGETIVWGLRFLGGCFVIFPVLGLLGKHLRRKKEEQEKSFFLKNGTHAMATLLSVKRTGVFLNKVPQFEFEFKIESDRQMEMKVQVKKYIRFVDLSEISEGMKVPAYIHPENDGKIFLMWEEVGIGRAF